MELVREVCSGCNGYCSGLIPHRATHCSRPFRRYNYAICWALEVFYLPHTLWLLLQLAGSDGITFNLRFFTAGVRIRNRVVHEGLHHTLPGASGNAGQGFSSPHLSHTPPFLKLLMF
jgi:hypothetical protein